MSDPKDPGNQPGAADGDPTILRSAKDFYGNKPEPEPTASRADRLMGRAKGDSSSGGQARPAQAPSGATPQRSSGPLQSGGSTQSAPPQRTAGQSGPSRTAGSAPSASDHPMTTTERVAASKPRAATDQGKQGSGRPGFVTPAAGAAAGAASGAATKGAPGSTGEDSGPADERTQLTRPRTGEVVNQGEAARPGATDKANKGDKPGVGGKAAAASATLGAAGGALASRLKGLRGGAGEGTRTGEAATAVPRPSSKEDSSEPSGVPSSTTGTQPAVRRSGARRTRKARLRLAQIDPWSVMKTAFLFSVAAGIVLWVATGTVWAVIGSSGIFDSLNSMIGSIIQTPGDDTPFRIQDYVDTNRVMGTAALIAVIDVVIFTALATLAAFLYNLASAMIGGLEVTLAED
ncbi:hypothetical protein GCM10027418_22740 [Mariniluteicoccus endophyticus]